MLSTLTQKELSRYIYYRQSKEELKNRIKMELYFWGEYDNIPFGIKIDINNRITELNRLANDLNEPAISEQPGRVR